MSYPYRRNVWGQVAGHTWKYTRRTKPVGGIIWHSTRGGQNYPGNIEQNAYVNWAVSPGNINYRSGAASAGIANVGIGPLGVDLTVDLAFEPRFSSWPADTHAISIEVAQSNPGQPIEKETIAHCVRFAEYLRNTYDIPRQRVFPTNDSFWRGETGHEDTIQGKFQGKTDPGTQFWIPYLSTWGGTKLEQIYIDILRATADLLVGNPPNQMPPGIAGVDAWYLSELKRLGGNHPNLDIHLVDSIQNQQRELSNHVKNHPTGSLPSGTEFTAKILDK